MSSEPPARILPVQRETISERVAHTLREYIDEHLEPGDRLPSERALCQRLGVGRTTLREGLRLLQSEGRLTVRAGSGAYVTARGDGTGFGQWPERLDVTVEELLQVRVLLEPPAAALAALADLPREAKARALQPSLDAMERAVRDDELERRVAADLAFHNAVAQLAGNHVLVTTLDRLSTLLTESRRVSLSYKHRLPAVHDAHMRICGPILDGEPDAAARCMAHHLAAFGLDMGLGPVPMLVPQSRMEVMSVAEMLTTVEASESDDLETATQPEGAA